MVKTGIAGEKYFEVLSGSEGRRQRGRRSVQLGRGRSADGTTGQGGTGAARVGEPTAAK